MLSAAVGAAKGAMSKLSPKLSRSSWGSSDDGSAAAAGATTTSSRSSNIGGDGSSTGYHRSSFTRVRNSNPVTTNDGNADGSGDTDDDDVGSGRDSGAETPLPDIDGSEDEELPPLPGTTPPERTPPSRRRVPNPEALERAVWAAAASVAPKPNGKVTAAVTAVAAPTSARKQGGSRLAASVIGASDEPWLSARSTSDGDGTDCDDGTGSAEDDPGNESAIAPLIAAARRATRYDPPLKFRTCSLPLLMHVMPALDPHAHHYLTNYHQHDDARAYARVHTHTHTHTHKHKHDRRNQLRSSATRSG
jgi:hypothetical protein